LEFSQGKFDEWCIFMCTPVARYAPLDSLYFHALQHYANKHGAEKIYTDFVKIFDYTTQNLNPKLLAGIGRLASQYAADTLAMDKIFTILYAGMVAEENKDRAILKKRIKRLGMYQILIEKRQPEEAANFSKAKSWQELDALCQTLGF
jgi:hypothetical protein